jgi:hypothetical protein
LLIHLISFFNRLTECASFLGDIQVNEDGSKTMNDKDQKIIHRWNYELLPIFLELCVAQVDFSSS